MKRVIVGFGLLLALLGIAGDALATPFTFSYGGRLADGNGNGIVGPVTIAVKFYTTASGGSPINVVSPQVFSNVPLADGTFQVDLTLLPEELTTLFTGAGDTFAEVTDQTHGVTYPRQKMTAIPYAINAMKVPVDGTTIQYNSDGQLTASQAGPTAASSIAGEPVGTTAPLAGQLLQFNGNQWVGVPDPALNKAGDTMAGALNMGNNALTNIAAPVNSGDAATKAYVDTDFGLTLKKDGSIPLAAAWNEGAQDITNTGNILMAPAKVLGLGVTSDPGSLGPSDKGKFWYSSSANLLKFFDGSTTQTLGVSGAGVVSLDGLTIGTQTLGIGTSGTTPNWASTGSVHTLNMPMASTGGTAAGLLSNSDWSTFNAKQAAITSATTLPVGGVSLSPNNSTAGQLRFLAAGGNGYVALQAPSSASGDPTFILPSVLGSSSQVLTTDGSGTLSWGNPANAQTLPTPTTTGTTLQWTDSGTSHTLNLPMAATNAVAAGLLANSDWNTFNNKQPLLNAASAAGPLSYSGGVFSLPPAGLGASGFLASSDWSTFNGKQAALGYSPVNRAGDTMSGALTSTEFNSTGTGNASNPDFAVASGSGLFKSGGGIALATSGTDQLHIMSNGNVGIGTNNPGSANVAIMTGFVGIGTTNPVEFLDVTGTVANNIAGINVRNLATSGFSEINFGNDSQTFAMQVGMSGSGQGGSGMVWNEANAPMLFGTDNFERMRITPSGNVGIGTNTPGVTLDVNGVTRTTGLVIGTTSITTNNQTIQNNVGVALFSNTAAISVTLPPSPTTGQFLHLKMTDTAAGNVTLGLGTTDIDGATSYVLSNPNQYVDLIYDGTPSTKQWRIVGQSPPPPPTVDNVGGTYGSVSLNAAQVAPGSVQITSSTASSGSGSQISLPSCTNGETLTITNGTANCSWTFQTGTCSSGSPNCTTALTAGASRTLTCSGTTWQ